MQWDDGHILHANDKKNYASKINTFIYFQYKYNSCENLNSI